MYTAIIAEDSKPILRNIRALMQSAELPVRIAAAVSNGVEALEYIKAHPVDILLTDIRMPKLDGLALIEQGKRVNPGLKAVLISGYSDFEYTRKALNLQVFDYLLKPVERHQLVEVLERLVGQLDERQGSGKALLEGIVEPHALSTVELGAEFLDGEKLMLLLCRQPFTPEPEAGCWKADTVQSCLAEACAPHSCWVFPVRQSGQLLALVKASALEAHPSIHDWLKRLHVTLQARGIQVSIAAEPQPAENRELIACYEQLDRRMKEQLSVSARLICQAYPAPKGILTDVELEKLTRHFAEMIGQRQKERFMVLLRQQLMTFKNSGLRMAELERFIWSLAEAFRSTGRHQQPEEWQQLEEEVQQLLESGSYEGFGESLLAWAEQSFEWLQLQNKKSGEELFRQLEQYLQQHIYAQISIADVALKFHVSPSYISRIIKRYSQKTFVHYFMQLKIAEARRLIAAKPELKVKELSEVLSFGDQHYFSKVFKEYTGCSPTEYKEGWTGSGPALPPYGGGQQD
ncbi:response regulator [Paenibacillus sp. S150]|uniref:response regulator transcription factor n=1 Tax=Paenibacillus sp. S150 TaxID=2749826 RepID=UPI001C560228|nr:response regulator [Paenibacillus sp. S150]MBW4084296.1 response regulator [Paenibacillus sp. S150]